MGSKLIQLLSKLFYIFEGISIVNRTYDYNATTQIIDTGDLSFSLKEEEFEFKIRFDNDIPAEYGYFEIA